MRGPILCLAAVLALLAHSGHVQGSRPVERPWPARQLHQAKAPEVTFPPPGTITGMRLVNGSTPQEGRLEVQLNGTVWSTVCDSEFMNQAADVACRALNSSWADGLAVYGAAYGEGTGPVLFTYFWCTGTEQSLLECAPGFEKHNDCTHENDVGLVCLPQGTEGAITASRLVNGRSPLSGRLEVQIDHTWWGTVCDVDDTTARAVCRELGHPYGRVAHPWGAFGPGTGAVAVRRIECPAGAASLSRCDYSLGSWDPAITWTRDSPCWHGNDVSIECFAQPPEPVTGIRLVNGTANSGRLEVQVEGYGWGTVCWINNKTVVDVACRQLGFPAGGIPLPAGSFGRGSGPILLNSIVCQPGTNQTRLDGCDYNNNQSYVQDICADHSSDVALACFNTSAEAAAPITGVRFLNGNSSQGVLEVQLAGVAWGSVCGSPSLGTYSAGSGPSIYVSEATVICRTAGHAGSGLLLPSGAFGPASSPWVLTIFPCTGNETSVNECSLDFSGICSPQGPISIACVNGTVTDPDNSAGPVVAITAARLVGGPSASQGRLEVQYQGAVWGSVCSTRFGTTAATVACRQAGFGGSGAVLPASTFGPSPVDSPILIGSAGCPNSTLASLSDCSLDYDVSQCDHSMDVALACQGPAVGASQTDGTGT